ncbi:hemocyte protein-glutamine gamma-glutamyltransferase-like [Neocloeon triangulifer]|uniref:hemocyte protein-glutamine gamma-glutamyltransferase-like n=1 Tax=Neocloeon triangulifer TaxID=2078957 RepID=UPI00286EC3B0|nr:hemocyte protein-glutamine gamma-glutamyltransferase-like [Neocloeon triangulifer]
MPGETAWSRVSVSPEPPEDDTGSYSPAYFNAPFVPAALTVKSVSLEALQNASAHQTRRFELVRMARPTPIFRRAQHFDVIVKFKENRAFDLEKDALRLVFSIGRNPNPLKGTQGLVSILNDASECWPPHDGRWYGRLQSSSETETKLEVRAAADAPVGVWSLTVETGVKEDPTAAPKVFAHNEHIYLLFNPWVKDDATFMENKSLLDEYVLTDVGKIWMGSRDQHHGRQWVFGQFDKAVLPAAMYVLEKTNLDHANRGNPILLSRAISKLVNSNDDAGVLVGNWSGEYSLGTAPSAWTGSAKILEQYYLTRQPVKYGQCWVFAGVTTTICRALGLPSRAVTNLVSAHDSNASLTVDKFYDINSRPMENGDSIWNFHVWNEAWMARPDLPKGYGGWQAIDATPQETSDGVYQCGPASLQAIRQGSVGLKYDVPFLIASVNADVIYWKYDPTSEIGYRRMSVSTAEVGFKILTKKANMFDHTGQSDAEDITLLYKAKEGSQMERSAMYNAARGSKNAQRYLLQPGEAREDIKFTLSDLEKVNVGENFPIEVNIKNEVDDVRTLDVILSASSVYYNGVEANLIKKAAGKFKIRPGGKDTLRLAVTPEEYLPKLVEYGMMKIFAVATVLETKQTWAAEDDFQIVKPKIAIKVPDGVTAKKVSSIEFSVKNPLKTTLHNCKLQYEGPHVLTPNVTLSMADIGPETEITVKGDVTPIRKGKFPLVAVFTSDELVDITGSATVDVTP